MKQTAVDFIIEKLAENGVLHSADVWMAKSIEKANIIMAVDCCFASLKLSDDKTMFVAITAEQYYNETFNKEV